MEDNDVRSDGCDDDDDFYDDWFLYLVLLLLLFLSLVSTSLHLVVL